MAAPAPAKPGEPPPASAPAPAASVQAPQTTETPAVAAPAAEPAKGPIPYDRHESILKNARTKTEQETVQRFQQQYGAHVELGTRFSADPVGTVFGLIEGLAQHPDHGTAVRSSLARILGSRRGAAEDTEPQADLQTSDGTLVYSAPQLAKWQAWQSKRLEAQIAQQLQPLQQREQQRIAQERLTQAQTDAQTRMSKVLEPYKKLLPDFDTHRPALREKSQAFLAEGYDAQTAIGLAVLSVINEKVRPAEAAQSRDQLAREAIAKATGSTSASSAAPAAPAGRPKDFESAFKRIPV